MHGPRDNEEEGAQQAESPHEAPVGLGLPVRCPARDEPRALAHPGLLRLRCGLIGLDLSGPRQDCGIKLLHAFQTTILVKEHVRASSEAQAQCPARLDPRSGQVS